MELPASEIAFWKTYYSIYPLPQERADQWMALLASIIYNTSGKTFKNTIAPDVFIFDYLAEKKPVVIEKSLEKQKEEWKAFKEKLRAVSPQSVS